MIAQAPVPDLSESFELSSVVWSALAKVAAKNVDHDRLEQGTKHDVDVSLVGHVDGMPFRQMLNTVVTIGHDQERATSATPDLPKLVALILSRLNQATREKLLREIPDEFERLENSLPDVDVELVDQTKILLKQLRKKKMVTARGAVTCDYSL